MLGSSPDTVFASGTEFLPRAICTLSPHLENRKNFTHAQYLAFLFGVEEYVYLDFSGRGLPERRFPYSMFDSGYSSYFSLLWLREEIHTFPHVKVDSRWLCSIFRPPDSQVSCHRSSMHLCGDMNRHIAATSRPHNNHHNHHTKAFLFVSCFVGDLFCRNP